MYSKISILLDCIYICGGVNSYSGSISSVEKYNPATDTWLSCGNMNHARGGHALISCMGKILAIGGVNSYMQTCKDAEWYNEVCIGQLQSTGKKGWIKYVFCESVVLL